ncbi:ThiF family adenylyltransferase [Legionella qingyii]|nr:ThiF family adenylyltransferase [Legionella qingyii]
MDTFDYNEAFSRNIGWVSEMEQQVLRTKKIAIAGMGGVGGINFLTSVRLGIGSFHITDFDEFELANFNRQIGATVSSIHHMKADVLIAMAKDINPNLNIQSFPNGVNPDNVNQFLDGVDLFFDCIDLFCIEARRLVYSECWKRKIPVIFSVPLGMGFGQVIFLPGKMSMEQYFNFDKDNSELNSIKLLLGVSPKGAHTSYLMDKSRVNLEKKKGPSTIMGCQFCAGAAVTEALKILLNRGTVYAAPYSHQYDGYRNKYFRVYMPYGNRNPIQKLRIFLAKKMFINKGNQEYPYPNLNFNNPIENILNLARWSPSAHNSQKWEFSEINDKSCKLSILSTDISGPSNQTIKINFLHAGLMLETLRLASSYFKHDFSWTFVPNEVEGDNTLHFNLNFKENLSITPDPLSQFIKIRFTDRRPYQLKKINPKVLEALKQSISINHGIVFKETFKDKWRFSLLDARAQKTMMLHPKLIHFFSEKSLSKNDFPSQGIPLGSFNISFISRLLSRYIQKKPKLFHTFMVSFKGYLLPLLKVSIISNMFSGAQFSIVRLNNAHSEQSGVGDINSMYLNFIEDGQMVQRFWLTCAQHGISICPSYFAILLSRSDTQEYYAKDFEKHTRLLKKIGISFNNIHGSLADNIIFSGRIGYPKNYEVKSRSLRLLLTHLIKKT